jgi:RNA polymerase sigma-70 factor (ECF subfamily)
VEVTVDREALEVSLRAHWSRGDLATTTTALLDGYGDELLGFLIAIARSHADGEEAFGVFCERLWKSMPRYRGECSFRTWSYTIARQAMGRVRRDPHRRRARPLGDARLDEVAARVRSRTASHLRTEGKAELGALRDELPDDDRALLILRINRRLAWKEIARVLAVDEPDDAALARQAAALRKKFERIKDALRARRAAANGER